jgi:hypothetical protein
MYAPRHRADNGLNARKYQHHYKTNLPPVNDFTYTA